MLSKIVRGTLMLLMTMGLLSAAYIRANALSNLNQNLNRQAIQTGSVYVQPIDPNGKLLLSSWLDPDGSDSDQYVWDNFTLQSNATITEIDWFGVYDPIRFGAGGPVLDFTVAIYASIAAGTEPAIANPPLVEYQIGGNAGETSIGMVGANPMYAYTFSLPAPFVASAGVKYWVQIEAFQKGTIPDWCFAAGSGGDGHHYIRTAGAGGDTMYRFAPGDAAFTLLGSVANTLTPPPAATATSPSTDIPTTAPTDTPAPTFTPAPATPTPVPPVPSCFGTAILFVMVLFLFRLSNR